MTSVDDAAVTAGFVSMMQGLFPDDTITDGRSTDLQQHNATAEGTRSALAVKLQKPSIVIDFLGVSYGENPGFAGGQSMSWVMYQFTVGGIQVVQVRDTANQMAHAATLDSNPFNVVGHAVIKRERISSVPVEAAGAMVSGGSRVRFLVQRTS